MDNAWKLDAKIIFFKFNESFAKKTSFIYIRIVPKIDENTAADLKFDKSQLTVKHPELQSGDFAASHGYYAVYAEVFFVPGKFYEYDTYLNPGKGKTLIISIAMNTGKKEATPEELRLYREVISSVTLLIRP